MLDLSRAPVAIHRLFVWLEAEGFEIERQRVDGLYNQFAAFVSGRLRVEVTADRGEWSLSLGMKAMSKQYSPDAWEAWAGNFPLAGEPSDLGHQVDFVVGQWIKTVGEAQSDVAAAQDAIQAIGEDWVYRRFGWRPPRS